MGSFPATALSGVVGVDGFLTQHGGQLLESRGRETSHSLNYQKLGKELMSQDELAVMEDVYKRQGERVAGKLRIFP